MIQIWDSDPNAGPANLVASATFGAASDGVSFEWDASGADLGMYEDDAAGEPDDTLRVINTTATLPVGDFPSIEEAQAQFDQVVETLNSTRQAKRKAGSVLPQSMVEFHPSQGQAPADQGPAGPIQIQGRKIGRIHRVPNSEISKVFTRPQV